MTGKEYMGRVAALPCVLHTILGYQQEKRTTVHHVREGQGISQRASDFLTVALCEDCHQGPEGLHGDRSMLRVAKVEELDLLAKTIQMVMSAKS